MDPHCFDADPEPDLDPAQNLDADPAVLWNRNRNRRNRNFLTSGTGTGTITC